MAKDTSHYLSRAIIKALKENPEITALVGSRVYPIQVPANPAWPYISMGVPIVSPFRATCMDGATQDFAIHAFAKTNTTRSGENRVAEISNTLAVFLDGPDGSGMHLELDTPYPAYANLSWNQTQIIQDAEAGSFHGIIQFSATIVS